MSKKYDIAVAIDTCVDILLDCGMVKPDYGQAEQLVRGYQVELGGSGGIFASAAARLGLKVAGTGVVGTDFLGRYVKEKLRQSGVDISYLYEDPHTQTGLGVSLCLDDHDRSILTYSGTIEKADGRNLPERLIADVRHIHISSYFLMKNMQKDYRKILAEAKRNQVTVSLDTNWDPEGKWDGGLHDILPYTDIILPNAKEAMAITGEGTLKKAVGKLLDQVPTVVLKDGSRGASAYTRQQTANAGSIEVPVADTVGAGDNFDAGFIFGFLQGRSLEECLQYGCICGSYSTRERGGIKGQARRGELLSTT